MYCIYLVKHHTFNSSHIQVVKLSILTIRFQHHFQASSSGEIQIVAASFFRTEVIYAGVFLWYIISYRIILCL